jgi:hypothetical protein
MKNEMTYAQALEIAINEVSDQTAVDRLTALKTSLENKSGKTSKKVLERRKENTEILQPAIVKFLGTTERATATQIAKGIEVPFEVTTSRATSALCELKASGTVTNTKEKRVSYYSLA